MNLSCALVFLFVVKIASGYTVCRNWTPWDQNEDPTQNIVGGTEIKADGDFPYLVSLRYPSGQHACGGSILNKRYILTAAHCFDNKTSFPVSIQYGKVEIDPRGPNVVAIRNFIIHENYNADDKRALHDIALIKLKEDIRFGKYASPVSLPHQNEVIPETNNMLVMGWGSTKIRTVPGPVRARYTVVSKFADDYCVFYRGLDSNYQFCGGLMEGGRGTCNGDSGGPVMINGKQYGIVSTSSGTTCAEPGKPEHYTRIPAYRLWINNLTGV